MPGIAEDTLLFGDLGLTNVRYKARIRGPAARKVLTRLFQAQLPIHGESHLGGVGVFLAIVLPPANGAQSHRRGRIQGSIAAAWTAKSSFTSFHSGVDANPRRRFTAADRKPMDALR